MLELCSGSVPIVFRAHRVTILLSIALANASLRFGEVLS